MSVKRSLVPLALLLIGLVIAACGGGGTSTSAPAAQPTSAAKPAAPAAPTTGAAAPAATGASQVVTLPTVAPLPTGVTKQVQVKPGQTKVTFWHAMGGVNGQAVQAMVDAFNASQDKYVVEATFQGTYDNSLAKLRAGLASKDVPSLVQVYDIGTRLMIDLNVATPMQTFIDQDKFDTSDLEAPILNYYSVNKQLWSMPFNSSNPILYYNKDAFKQAGLDPDKPPRTWDQVHEAAKKFKGVGQFQCGLALMWYGWFFEQWQAVGGQYFADNENGRTAPATKVVFNNDYSNSLLSWMKSMIDDGSACNAGRQSAGGTDNAEAAFTEQKAAMYLESTARLGTVFGKTEAKGTFKLGTAFFPRQNEADYQKSGTIIGGASVWILKDRPEAEQRGAWEFVKFAVSPEQQAKWHTTTGYYPVRKSAYELPADKEWRQKYPQFETAKQQLQQSPINNYTAGALLGVFPTARQAVEMGMEDVMLGKTPIKDMLDKSTTTITKEIDTYNRTVRPR